MGVRILILGIFLVFFLHGAASRWLRIARHGWIWEIGIYIVSVAAFFTIGWRFSNYRSLTTMEDLFAQGIPLILLAWLLFRFASFFPFLLDKLFRQGVLRTLVTFKWLIPSVFLLQGEVLNEDEEA